jgi:hypothetical protein
MAGLARWASVVLPLAGGSVALGDGGLLATSGVMGLASSLSAISEAEIQAIDARAQSEAIAAQSATVEMRVLPRPVPVRRVVPRPGLPRVDESPIAAPAVFRPARPRTAAEQSAEAERVNPTAPAHEAPSRPSVKAPAQIDGPRPQATRPVTGDRPPLPFSRLFSQVQY